ncbi:hypothetical protein LCGC14_1931170, partial [marine sediment metagenome]
SAVIVLSDKGGGPGLSATECPAIEPARIITYERGPTMWFSSGCCTGGPDLFPTWR